MIKNIIFDLGNVLLDQKTITADAYFATVLKISKEDSKTFYEKYNRDAVAGFLPFIDLVRLYKRNFKCDLSEKEITKQYQQLYINDVSGVNTQLMDLIKSLRKNYSIYMMTNTLKPHFDHWKKLRLSQYFDKIFRSDTDHFMKPEKQSYVFVVKEIGGKTEECIFIDDFAINIDGAKSVGLKGILYKDNYSLIKDLLKFGIKI